MAINEISRGTCYKVRYLRHASILFFSNFTYVDKNEKEFFNVLPVTHTLLLWFTCDTIIV